MNNNFFGVVFCKKCEEVDSTSTGICKKCQKENKNESNGTKKNDRNL